MPVPTLVETRAATVLAFGAPETIAITATVQAGDLVILALQHNTNSGTQPTWNPSGLGATWLTDAGWGLDPVFTDDFNRVSLGLDWSVITGSPWTIVSNEGASIDSSFNHMRAVREISSADAYTQATMAAFGSSFGVGARMQAGTETGYVWRYNGTDTQLFSVAAGTYTSIGTAYTASQSAGAVFRIECEGSTIRGYINGILRQTATNTAVPGAGNGTVRHAGSASRVDNFSCSVLYPGLFQDSVTTEGQTPVRIYTAVAASDGDISVAPTGPLNTRGGFAYAVVRGLTSAARMKAIAQTKTVNTLPTIAGPLQQAEAGDVVFTFEGIFSTSLGGFTGFDINNPSTGWTETGLVTSAYSCLGAAVGIPPANRSGWQVQDDATAGRNVRIVQLVFGEPTPTTVTPFVGWGAPIFDQTPVVVPARSFETDVAKAFWFKADLMGADGSSGATLTDSSGNGRHVTGSGGTVSTSTTTRTGKCVAGTAMVYNIPDLGLAVGTNLEIASTSPAMHPNYPALHLIDGNTGTISYFSSGTPPWTLTERIKAGGQVITGYTLRSSPTVGNFPRAWTFEGSMDGSTGWTTLDTRSSITATGANTDHVYTFSNPTPYPYYRWVFTANNGGAACELSGATPNGVTAGLTQNDATLFWVVRTFADNYYFAKFGNSGQSNHFPYGGTVYDDVGLATRTNFTPPSALAPVGNWRLYEQRLVGTSQYLSIDNNVRSVVTGTRSWALSGTKFLENYNGRLAEQAILINPTEEDLGLARAYFRARHWASVT